MTTAEDELFSDIHDAVAWYCEAKGIPLSVDRVAASMQATASDEAYAIKLENFQAAGQGVLL